MFADVEKMRREIEELRGAHGGRDLRAELQTLEREGKALEAEIEGLRESADSLRENATEQNDVNAKEQFVEEETERLGGLCDELNDALGELLSKTARPDHELLQQLNAELETAKAEEQRVHGDARARHARARDEMVGAERGRAAQRAEADKLQADVAELEAGAVARARAAIDDFNRAVSAEADEGGGGDDDDARAPPVEWRAGDDPNQVVERMSAHIAAVVKKHAKDSAATTVAEGFRTHLLEGSEKKRDKCPCCKQHLDAATKQSFLERLNKSINEKAERDAKHERYAATLNACKERVSKLSRAVDEFSRKRDRADELATELAGLEGAREALERAERDASAAVDEAARREADLGKLQVQLDKAMDLSTSIERKRSEMDDLKQRIATCARARARDVERLPAVSPPLSLSLSLSVGERLAGNLERTRAPAAPALRLPGTRRRSRRGAGRSTRSSARSARRQTRRARTRRRRTSCRSSRSASPSSCRSRRRSSRTRSASTRG